MASGQKSWAIEVVRLAGLLTATGMAASRIGLLVHEIAGHGGVAVALGGEVTKLRLFWFGGGWISYAFESPTTATYIACSVGGIAVEAVIGAAILFGLARADTRATAAGQTNVAIRAARAVGAAALLHAFWYFGTGTWHGYGDGIPLHRALGDWRYPAAIVAGLFACVVAFAGARIAFGAFAAALPRWRTAGVVIAIVTSLVVLGGLAVAEFKVREDTRYGAIMERAGDRKAARELAAWQRAQARRGALIDEAARQAEARRLRERHAEPPFAIPLAIALFAAIVFGAFRTRAAEGARVTRRQLIISAAISLGSLATVIAIDVSFR